MDKTYRTRRFTLAALYAVGGTVALFLGFLPPTPYVTLAGVVLGLYGGIECLLDHKEPKHD